MPGVHTPNPLVKKLRDFPFAEFGIKTHYGAFFFANIDDMLVYDWDAASFKRRDRPSKKWDAVWLDYTGPLTVKRLELIKLSIIVMCDLS